MWKRFADRLRCPVSGEALTLVPFRETNAPLTDQMAEAAATAGYRYSASQRDFCRRVDSGVLLAPSAGLLYPIVRGVPLMVPYETILHATFARDFSTPLSKFGPRYRFPSCPPQPVEQAILRSINRGVPIERAIATNGHHSDEHLKLVSAPALLPSAGAVSLLDVGCGLGHTTAQVRRQLKCDAVGVDLSTTVVEAADRFRNNPMLHFAQASAFHLPFEPPAFDVICAHGTHHSYATREALLAMAAHCRPGGRFYVWVDAQSADGTPLQRMATAAGTALRPLFNRAPEAIGTAMLASIALGYIGVNRLRRQWDDNVPPFTFDRALVSARDRLAPTYARRQRASQVMDWFREAGFEGVEVVDGQGRRADGNHDGHHAGVRGSRPVTSARASISH